jgi:ubiquinone/menaquinone biosynthesis C-methylase UbiE
MSESGFDATTIRSAYESVADEYAATFVDDLANLELDRRVLDVVADHSTGLGPVLDVGCGPAQVSGYLLGRHVEPVGIDFTPAMLAVARRRIPLLRVAIGDLRALPVRGGSIAGVVAYYVLQHVPRSELGTALREVRRVLTRDGVFAAAFHEGDREFRVGAVTATRYGTEELSEQLANASLAVQTVDHRGPLPHEHQGDRCYIVARAT